MTTTLATLQQEMSGEVDGYITISGSGDGAAGGTTFVDATSMASYPDDHFNGRFILITSGTYSGEERQISGYAQSTGTITVSPAFGGQIVADVTAEIHWPFRPSEMTKALNLAIKRTNVLFRRIEDDSTISYRSDYEYPVPADIETGDPHEIWIQENVTDQRYPFRRLLNWQYIGDNKIRIPYWIPEGRILRMVGGKRLTQLTNSDRTTTTEVDESDNGYLIALGLAYCYEFRMNTMYGQNRDQEADFMDYWLSKAETRERDIVNNHLSRRTVKNPFWIY